jgi:hypothetical protein
MRLAIGQRLIAYFYVSVIILPAFDICAREFLIYHLVFIIYHPAGSTALFCNQQVSLCWLRSRATEPAK